MIVKLISTVDFEDSGCSLEHIGFELIPEDHSEERMIKNITKKGVEVTRSGGKTIDLRLCK